MNFKQPFFLIACILLTTSCLDDDFNLNKISSSIDMAPSLGIPIVTGKLSIMDAVKNADSSNTKIYADDAGLLHLTYKNTFDTIKASSFLRFIKDYEMPFDIPQVANLPVHTPLSITLPFDYTLLNKGKDQVLENAEFDEGIIELGYFTNMLLSTSSSFTISSSDIVLSNGNTLNQTITPSNTNTKINLKGATYSGKSPNKIAFTVKVTLTKTAASSDARDFLSFKFGLKGIELSCATGNIGDQQLLLRNNKIDFNISTNIVSSGGATIKAPRVKLVFENQVGVGFSFVNNGIEAIFNGNKEVITGLPSNITVEQPLPNENIKVTESFIASNSNLIEVLSKFPDHLLFDGTLSTKGSSQKDRLQKDQHLVVKGDIDLPLNIMLKDVVFCDTLKADFDDLLGSADSKIDFAKLKVKLSNRYPFDVDIQGFLMDESNHLIEPFFSKPVSIKSGVITNESVTAPSSTEIILDYSKDRISKLKRGKSIIFTVTATTGKQDQAVKIEATNRIDVKIIGFIKANLNS